MPSAADLVLTTDGVAYGGWKSVRVSAGLEHCSGTFDLAVTELWPGQDYTKQIAPFAACQVSIAGEPIITGYVDEPSIDGDAESHVVTISGRDKTEDLIDCSAIVKAGQWASQKIEAIASTLAAPFGIKVIAAVDTGKPLSTFSLQEGETVFEAIDRAAKIRALLLTTDGLGNLVITRAGATRISTPLVYGQNIKKYSGRFNVRDRFSQYVFKGQTPALAWSTDPNSSTAPTSASQVKATAKDAGVPRYRPLVITSEQPDIAVTLNQRAAWEANVRAARSVEVRITVNGWLHAQGAWRPDALVYVDCAPLRINDNMLVKSVQFSLDDSGAITELTLTQKEAYTLLPLNPQGASPLAFTEPAKGASK